MNSNNYINVSINGNKLRLFVCSINWLKNTYLDLLFLNIIFTNNLTSTLIITLILVKIIIIINRFFIMIKSSSNS